MKTVSGGGSRLVHLFGKRYHRDVRENDSIAKPGWYEVWPGGSSDSIPAAMQRGNDDLHHPAGRRLTSSPAMSVHMISRS